MENEMRKVSYYPGCSLEVTAKAFNTSTRQTCEALDLELAEIPDWDCCGSSAALKKSRNLSLSLASKVLAQAETQDLGDVVVPCPFCYRRLLSANQELEKDPDAKARTEKTLERSLNGHLNIQNLLGFVRHDVGLEAIKAKNKNPLKGLKVIPYYGCYTVKPVQVTQAADQENPTEMDDILKALGAEVLDWDFKTECCGASLSLCKTEKVLELSSRLLKEALFRGADAVVVACQLCQSNLDMRQKDIQKTQGLEKSLPVIYFTQLMGLAFGMAPKALGMHSLMVNPIPILKENGLVS